MKLHDAYELCDQIGEGTYSRVFRAKRRSDGAEHAIKRLKQAQDGARVLAELKCLQALHEPVPHPHIVRLIGGFRDGHSSVDFVTELFPHDDFAKALEAGRFTVAHIATYMRGLFSALAHIHEKGYIHRHAAAAASA